MSVAFEVQGHVARVTIDRPDRLNAVDNATSNMLSNIWDKIESTPDIRCVVLTGSGDKAFSAGADLKDDTGLSGVEYWRAISKGYRGISLRNTLITPVIARVNGLALGGGLEMVLGCDIVIAADSARFGLPEAKVGRVPLDGGMTMLPRLIPRNVAVGMMMTGRMVSAAEMAGYGLVNAVVPFEELDSEVDQWADQIVAAAPLSVRAIKHVTRQTAAMSIHQAFEWESEELLKALNSVDAEEGVSAFREKRAPNWQGR